MKVHATVLTVPTGDTPGTNILVHFDDRRYVFGHIAEGSQRAFVERRVRVGKVQDVFLTGRTEWATTGGLVGFLLTIGDARKADEQRQQGKPVTIHGGDNLLQAIAATRSFVFRGELKLSVDEIGDKVFKDGNVSVKTLRIRSRAEGESGTSEQQHQPQKRHADEMESPQERMAILKNVVENMFASQKNINKTYEQEEVDPLVLEDGREGKRSRSSSGDGLPMAVEGQLQDQGKPRAFTTTRSVGYQRLPKSTPSPVALSYIMIQNDHRGKFLPQVARELGVTPGPSFGMLSNGKSVTTKSGRVVHPHEVLEPPIVGTGIAVCDLPDASYVADFVAHLEWTKTEELQTKIGAFFWILGPGLSSDPQLIAFMERFPKAKHILASLDVCTDPINFKGAAKFTTRLNLLDPVFFPALQSRMTPTIAPPKGTLVAEPGLVFNISPEWSVDSSQIPEPFSAEQAISPEEAGADFISIAIETRESLCQFPPEKEIFPGSDVEVYTLGTGSALPSRYRNVSCTLVTIPDNCSILLDCGENTVGQMKRVLGPDAFPKRLLDIKVLYISHLHADHHLGSIAFLKEQRQLLTETGNPDRPTYVVAPQRFWTWLTDYSSVEDFGIDKIVFLPNEQLRVGSIGVPTGLPQLLRELDIVKWDTAPALHCQSSFTTAVTFSDGFKLAYSGDTRPTRSFVDIGMGSTLLVHEATFDDELREEAVAKKHSTIGEAIRAGQMMRSRKTALVHFSQRYPKAPTFGEDDQGNVIYGFDYMRFCVGEIGRFKRLVKGLAEVYRGEEEGNVD